MPKKRGKRRDKNGKKKGVAALRELEGDIAKLLVDCLPQLEQPEAEAHSSCLLDELTDLPPQSWPTDVATWVELLSELFGEDLLSGTETQIAESLNGWVEPPVSNQVALGTDSDALAVEIGTTGLAVLTDDGVWRNCTVTAMRAGKQDGSTVVQVSFTEAMGLGKKQWVDLVDFRPEWELVFDDDDEGICELCEREMPLTFHHLFPKATHERIATHGLPADADATLGGALPEGIKGLTKDFMQSYGCQLCRPCHSSVHRAEDNRTLAEKYHTVALLQGHEKIASFVDWARRQRPQKKSDAVAALQRRR